MNKKIPVYLLFVILITSIVSCKDSDTDPSTPSSNVAVTSFSLSADTSVLVNLDSVFFSIDLTASEVFNADSLPKGTDVKKLVIKIGYPAVSSAKLYVKGGERLNDTVIDYMKNPNDSVDFTGNVTFELVSEDKTVTRQYSIKVNVHNMVPDSLFWNLKSRRDLPAPRLGNLISQKTVEYQGSAYCLMMEKIPGTDNYNYLISHISNPALSDWTTKNVNFTFTPNLKSFESTDNALYILSNSGELYTSQDGIDWIACGTSLYNITGYYGDKLLGIIRDDGVYKHDIYPRPAGFEPYACEEDFPVTGASQMITFNTEWSLSAQGIIVGGVDKNNETLGDTWGYDGNVWAKISHTPFTPHSGMVLFPYFTFKTNTKNWTVTKLTTWFAVGGFLQEGKTVSKDVYISLDNGLNWKKGDVLVQLPEYISAFAYGQGLVFSSQLSSRSSATNTYWEELPARKLPVWFMIAAPVASRSIPTTWDCPYIYLFGGENASGGLMKYIWKGAINRLTFKPLI